MVIQVVRWSVKVTFIGLFFCMVTAQADTAQGLRSPASVLSTRELRSPVSLVPDWSKLTQNASQSFSTRYETRVGRMNVKTQSDPLEGKNELSPTFKKDILFSDSLF